MLRRPRVASSCAMSRAILRHLPARMPSSDPASATRSRRACQGASGSGSSSSCASRSATCGPSRRAPRARRWRRRTAAPASRCEIAATRARAVPAPSHISASLNPNGIGRARCSQVRPTAAVCDAGAPMWPGPRRAGESQRTAPRCRPAGPSTSPGIEHVLAGRAPVHIAAPLRHRPWRPSRSAP